MAPILYTFPNSSRSAKGLIAAQYVKQEITIVPDFQFGVTNRTPEYLEKFPTGTVPALEDGELRLCESNAIAYYIASLKHDSHLLGHSNKQKAEVVQWMSYSDNRIVHAVGSWIYPVLGYMPYSKPAHTKAVEDLKKAFTVLNTHLKHRTFFVGERVTLADIVIGCELVNAYRMLLAPEHRVAFKNVNRWFLTLVHQPEFKAVWGEVKLATEEQKHQPPKKEEKKKEEKKEEKKKKKEEEEEEEDDIPREPKAKSALDSLPPTTLNLEEWKRFYSNNDTKPTAMNWFWEHFDPSGYSIWRVDYKYNDELTKIFMSANLIGGFFNRLERARKYVFGSLCVLGEDNANSIAGYFVIRGHEVPFEVYDAADYDSYTFVKVDHKDPKVKTDIADYFAWEGDFGGKKFADAKVFK